MVTARTIYIDLVGTSAYCLLPSFFGARMHVWLTVSGPQIGRNTSGGTLRNTRAEFGPENRLIAGQNQALRSPQLLIPKPLFNSAPFWGTNLYDGDRFEPSNR